MRELPSVADSSLADRVAHAGEFARAFHDANAARDEARDRLKEAVVALCRSGMSEVAVADLVGVSRLTVRAWRGKPVARSQK